MMKRLISLLSCLLITIAGYSQTTDAPQMGDTFRSEGKIYVVVLVLSIVFVCLATYLIIIDRRLKKLEDKIK